ncbi:Arc family DNA-binding protein [Aminobacter anthyllidis]|uniref:Arc family DNA-binding protein n=1 Tax=Aminobacter anthyllidis TaxID=1035067 RepID=A0A9X1A6N3_9HYPH|nr:Arc family DNA-binding protein [Aminobacter anthyllidis]
MPQRDDPRHNLRLPPLLKAKLAHSAIDSGRSMNAEILARLEASFTPEPTQLISELLQPMASLSEPDKVKLGELLVNVGAILAKPTTTK